MSELKRCPFCGGEAHLTKKNRIIIDGKTERECHVHCTKCNARAERVLYKSCATTEMAHELAKAFWNTRKPMDKIKEQLNHIHVGMDSDCRNHCKEYDSSCNWCSGDCEIYVRNRAIEIVEKGGME